MIDRLYLDRVIERALDEDMPLGDLTTDALVPEDATCRAVLLAKSPVVLAGLDVARRAFEILDPAVSFQAHFRDGDRVPKGARIADLAGNTKAVLKAERTALNLLQRMCGIATRTAAYVAAVQGTKARIVDTRKTAPGLRRIDKYAVVAGGGSNHRHGLSDGVLIKDNHIVAAGGIRPAVERARAAVPHTVRIEVETESLAQVREALDCRADIIMLDNMDLAGMREAVALIAGRALVEASGNVNMDRVRGIAETGVDLISIGELTHSVTAADISLRFE
jgi:nicotinate-nucleotide pyrophosphorylase (carboxylating)